MPSNLAGAPEIQPYDAADPVPKVDSPVPWRRHGPLYLLREGSCPLQWLWMCSCDKIRRHWPQTSGPPTISELGQLKGWQVNKGDSIPRPWEFTGPLCCGRMPSVGNKILRAQEWSVCNASGDFVLSASVAVARLRRMDFTNQRRYEGEWLVPLCSAIYLQCTNGAWPSYSGSKWSNPSPSRISPVCCASMFASRRNDKGSRLLGRGCAPMFRNAAISIAMLIPG